MGFPVTYLKSRMPLTSKLPYLSPVQNPSTSVSFLHNLKPSISSTLPSSFHLNHASQRCSRNSDSFSVSSYGWSTQDPEEANGCSFDEAVFLFNQREYYECHDVLEALWNIAEEPGRTLIHGILQSAIGLHHLLNKNHRGAMMELGEGLCKIRKMNFHRGPFHQFEQDIAAMLDFIYQTQIELAACTNDLCQTMDQSETSYLLLGGYAAGQHLYHLQNDPTNQVMYIVFNPQRSSYESTDPPRVKLPKLEATEEHLRIE